MDTITLNKELLNELREQLNNEFALNELREEYKRLKSENENNKKLCSALRKSLDTINLDKSVIIDECYMFEHLDDDDLPAVPANHNGDYRHSVFLRVYVPCNSEDRAELENVWTGEYNLKYSANDSSKMTATKWLDELQNLYYRRQSVQSRIDKRVTALLEKWIEDKSDGCLYAYPNIYITPSAGSYEIFDVEFDLATHDDDSIAEADWYAKEIVMNMIHNFPKTAEKKEIKVLKKFLDTEPDELYD